MGNNKREQTSTDAPKQGKKQLLYFIHRVQTTAQKQKEIDGKECIPIFCFQYRRRPINMENCLKLQNNKIRGESRSETTENMILQVDIGKGRKTSKDVEISESFSNVTFFSFFFSLSPTTVKFSNTPTHTKIIVIIKNILTFI